MQGWKYQGTSVGGAPVWEEPGGVGGQGDLLGRSRKRGSSLRNLARRLLVLEKAGWWVSSKRPSSLGKAVTPAGGHGINTLGVADFQRGSTWSHSRASPRQVVSRAENLVKGILSDEL